MDDQKLALSIFIHLVCETANGICKYPKKRRREQFYFRKRAPFAGTKVGCSLRSDYIIEPSLSYVYIS
jgi:hypothetical protein